jgi:hypothetical protein
MSATPPLLIDTALNRWRSNLIDLSRRNPLLALKAAGSTILPILQPQLGELFDQLVRGGKALHFHLPAEAGKKAKAPRPGELVTSEPERDRLLAILTNLYRRSRADYRERGLQILYLALGVLEWRDADDDPARSPVLLVPVELRRHTLREPFVLHALADEEPLVNPALAARLRQDFDFRLPEPPGDWDEAIPAAYLDVLGSAIAGLPGWQVKPDVVLSLFSFAKGVIFQDLQDNAERIKAHPIVQALAGMPLTLPHAELPDEAALDEQQDPHDVYHVLDADGSQRLCLESAARGESFVLIGPPGTGKSQTIANLIAESIARGRRVLFVSDKMAALEVVERRLREVGLGDFCLELHSHKANKREVVTELARCLEAREQSKAVPQAEEEFAKLRKRRDQLNGYVRALHQVREPMRRSAWDALAELPRWNKLPLIPLGVPAVRAEGDDRPTLALSEFTAGHLDELTGHLQRLQSIWHVRTEADFPWRGFKADRYSLQLRDEVLGLIDRIRGRGDKLRAAAHQYGQQLGVSGSVAGLLKLGDLLEKRPARVEASWLRAGDLDALAADLERCADQYQRLAQARKPLTDRYGPGLWSLPEGMSGRVAQAWKATAQLLSVDDERGAAFLALQQRLRAWAADTQKRVPIWLTELRTLDKWLALPLTAGAGAGSGLDPSAEDVRHFIRLVTLCQSDHPPDRRWLVDSQALAGALAVTSTTRAASAGFRHGRAALMQIYTEKIFELDLDRMAAGFAGPYRTWVRFFRRGWWRACSRLSRASRSGMLPASHADDVLAARDALAARRVLEAEFARLPDVLGRYDQGVDTDMDAADNAAKLAAEAVTLARSVGHETVPSKLGDALVSGSPPEKIRGALKRLHESFAGWWHMTEELQAVLPIGRLPQVGERLEACALSALAHYAKDLQAALNQLATLVDPVLRQTTPADVPGLIADLKQAEEVRAFEAGQEAEARRWQERFGPAFQGVGTDWDEMRRTLTWTRRVRECLKTLTGNPGDALAAAPPSVRELRQALEQYEQALHNLEVRFEPPGPLLGGTALREHGPDEVLDHLAKLRERVGALTDWIDWRHLPERFQHLGLGEFWQRLTESALPREHLVDVFRKAFWSTWLDGVFQQDPALASFRRSEHEQEIAEFRELDRRIIQLGAARVAAGVAAAAGNAASGDEGQVKLLLREANKKVKHLPLRRLFDEIPGLLARLKPCLLMSPLSVSQFLPAEPEKLHFDIAVFDEASQLLPEDAIGAIYRGRQLVVTGDNQQLPPTTFFQQLADADDPSAAEDEPVFESILDTSLAAGLPRRTLRWHYRSRHEGLIAFANDVFYDGKLITFPAPQAGAEAHSVRFQHVKDGAYDRGGRRDNPREAQAVVARVLDHFRNRPEQTLGVIALSYAQMEAIEDELERQLRGQPELERHFDGDRLGGFFVKNLETVQGDERDVIILSIGYGPDESGKLMLNFGPLNRAGGERRLNVAVTRAREELLVVSSIRAGDIELSPTSSAGLVHLRQYLDYAERGTAALHAAAAVAPPATALHEDVQHALREHGFDAVAHVGCGAVRIDLAVAKPDRPDVMLLGIEFDGPTYAQAVTARDRDRLRPEVLCKLGWRLHRIWAADWLHRRDDEVARLLAALGSPLAG